MSLIYNEKIYAERLLDGYPQIETIDDIPQPTRYYDWRDAFILSKYFRHIEGLKNKKIKERLLEFFDKNKIFYNDVKMGSSLDRAIKRSKNQQLRIVEKVEITQMEFDNIRSVKNFQLEKVLFVMIVICKALRQGSNYTGRDYILSFKFASILRIGKIYVNKNEANDYKTKLHRLGYINSLEPGRRQLGKGIESFKLLYVDTEDVPSPIHTTITDLDNIISFYDFHCLNCGKTIKRVTSTQKYCDDCGKKLKTIR